MISILCPTRNRPKELRRMVESAFAHAQVREIEIVIYADDDDTLTPPAAKELALLGRVHCVIGPRGTLSDLWNRCFEHCHGEIAMMGNDDALFVTPGWDRAVEAAFAEFPDRIAMVHATDTGHHYDKFGALPFVHRRWVEAIGYFSPPWFCGDYADTWLNEVANYLGRRRALLNVAIDHLHPHFGTAPLDATYRERLEKQKRARLDLLWKRLEVLRVHDARKLGALMTPPREVSWWPENDIAPPPAAAVAAAAPKWSILCLTQRSRGAFLQRLCSTLGPQVDRFADQVEFVTASYPGLPVGDARQKMVEAARGEYVSFVDDDDLVAADYVSTILPLLDGADTVGFMVELRVDGAVKKPTHHALRHGGWFENSSGYFRDLSHINPIRRALLLQVGFEGGFGEDARWADRMRAAGLVKTANDVDRVLYHYQYRSRKADGPKPTPKARQA